MNIPIVFASLLFFLNRRLRFQNFIGRSVGLKKRKKTTDRLELGTEELCLVKMKEATA